MSSPDRSIPSRRSLLGAAVVAGAGTKLAVAAPAAAVTAQIPRRWTGGSLLTARGRHLVGRFSYGVTPGLAAAVREAGGPDAWFAAQLDASSVADPGVDQLVDWWPGLREPAAELWRLNVSEELAGWEVMANYARWCLVRRIRSRRQVLEAMTEFWENHFNVPVDGHAAFTHRTSYGVAIRERALGTFEDLLQTAVLHPAMLIYLDNAVSTARRPNENLGRELLELHTVGRGNYTEDDVKDSARILTGWHVDLWRTWAASYVPRDHYVGPVRVMDFAHPNGQPDGQQVARDYLRHLAHHPATARRIARKLAVKFVRDDPPEALVEHLARVYLDHGTAVAPVLLALVDSPAFRDAVGAKVRDPGEDVVATYRALGVRVHAPTGDRSAANAILWQASSLGTRPFAWRRPDGQPVDNRSWSSPSRMIASMSVHYVMSGGWWPSEDIEYRSPASWAPRLPVRFDVLVDAVSQRILHRHATTALLEACCAAVDCTPAERITRDHPVMQWNLLRLLTTVLDSPAFFRR